MNIFEIMVNTAKAKISPALVKVKMWMKPSYVKNKVLVKFRNAFMTLFDVRPKDETDYYTLGRWLFSKKLALALVLIISILCGYYIWLTVPKGSTNAGYPSYKYNSVVLKFISDKVQILGKSGYKAYVGDVKNGIVSGTGTLYDPAGDIVYTGEFDANEYNGTGRLYDAGQVLKYEGSFRNNLYDGEGKEYQSNGSLIYEGEYQLGYRNGNGQLYDSSENLVYTGTFSKNQIVYEEMLGKSTTEVASMYTGIRSVYEGDTDYVVRMNDIAALYCGEDGSDSLSEEWNVNKIYVLSNQIVLGDQQVTNVTELKKQLGNPIYEGNTNLTLSDVVALNAMAEEEGNDILFGKAQMETENRFEDVYEISDYEKDYMVYLYVFEKDGITYQFFCKDIGKDFAYYSLEQ